MKLIQIDKIDDKGGILRLTIKSFWGTKKRDVVCDFWGAWKFMDNKGSAYTFVPAIEAFLKSERETYKLNETNQ